MSGAPEGTHADGLDADRRLALSYAPQDARGKLAALWALDAALGNVLRTGRNDMVSEIRLAWWRESLERLDEAPAPAEPVLEGLARHVVAEGIAGRELAAMESGWALLLAEKLEPEALALYAERRGAALFALSARLLGGEGGFDVRGPGALWALVDLARHSGPADAQRALAAARERAGAMLRWPRPLRPLGMLAMLALRDLAAGPGPMERPGSPRRMLRMLRHRLTGS